MPVVWGAALNLLNLSTEEARKLLSSQSQSLVFAKKLSSLPLVEPSSMESKEEKPYMIFYRGKPVTDFGNYYENYYEASQFHGQVR